MKNKKEINIKFLPILVLIIILAVTVISGCSSNPEASGEGNSGEISTGGGEASEAGHAETGGEAGGGGSNEAGEVAGHPEGGEGGSEGVNEAAGGEASGESGDPSSPILALNESWDGVVNGLRVTMSYDQATQAFSGIVENTTAQTICYVQIELNLKQGTKTVVELGPGPVGDLAPGAQANIQLLVADEPQANDVSFDAWEIHPEMFDCNGPAPVPHTGGEGGEGSGEGGHAEGAEGGESGGEESGNALALNDTYDMVRSGARLVMVYDAPSNSFIGMVINTSSSILTQVRVEVHLSNGVELGPTTRTDLAPGEVMQVRLLATTQPIDGWSPHAEVGSGEGGGTEGSEGSEGGGESGEGEHDEGGEGGGG